MTRPRGNRGDSDAAKARARARAHAKHKQASRARGSGSSGSSSSAEEDCHRGSGGGRHSSGGSRHRKSGGGTSSSSSSSNSSSSSSSSSSKHRGGAKGGSGSGSSSSRRDRHGRVPVSPFVLGGAAAAAAAARAVDAGAEAPAGRLPLPEDFFYIPPPAGGDPSDAGGNGTLTKTEWELYCGAGQTAMQELLLSAQAGPEDGWQSLGKKAGVALSCGETLSDRGSAAGEEEGGSSAYAVRGVTNVPASVRDVMELLRAGTSAEMQGQLGLLLPFLRDAKVLCSRSLASGDGRRAGRHSGSSRRAASSAGAVTLCWAALDVPVSAPLPLATRDFAFVTYRAMTATGIGVSAAVSVQTPHIPQLTATHGLTRGEIGVAGFVATPVDSGIPGEEWCEVSLVVQADAGGWVPAWVTASCQKSVGSEPLAALRAIFERRKAARVRLDSASRKRAGALAMGGTAPGQDRFLSLFSAEDEVFAATVPRGASTTVVLPNPEPGARVVLEFCTEEGDISFSARDAAGRVMRSPERCCADGEASAHELANCEAGNLSFVFDNGSSWFSAREVFYRCRIVARGQQS